MKIKLVALSVALLATGSVFAQSNDTLAKVKASGVVTMGVRDSSGALSYTLAGTDVLKLIEELRPGESSDDERLLQRLAPFLLAGLTAPLGDLPDGA